jgi:carotenoid 1,2-hydratase
MNVALYGATGHKWAMTERRRPALSRDADHLSIGPSALSWDKDVLTIQFDEMTSPLPSRLRGTVRLYPSAILNRTFDLDGQGRHGWRPIAPRSCVEVQLESPDCAWSGDGYFDTNAGREPLEAGFSDWDWSRAHRREDSLIFYDVRRAAGDCASLALKINAQGDISRIGAPPAKALAPTFWRVPRLARGDCGAPLQVRQTLEDTPFYTRSSLAAVYEGEPAEVMHESLSLDRFRMPVVQAMLAFRMPRIFW